MSTDQGIRRRGSETKLPQHRCPRARDGVEGGVRITDRLGEVPVEAYCPCGSIWYLPPYDPWGATQQLWAFNHLPPVQTPDLADAVEVEQLVALPYEVYLRTPHWLTLRDEALRRAEGKCQLCGARPGRLNVHHNTYERLGCERSADLIVLCRACHQSFHERGWLNR